MLGRSYVGRTLRLTSLAPDIVSIVQGKELEGSPQRVAGRSAAVPAGRAYLVQPSFSSLFVSGLGCLLGANVLNAHRLSISQMPSRPGSTQ